MFFLVQFTFHSKFRSFLQKKTQRQTYSGGFELIEMESVNPVSLGTNIVEHQRRKVERNEAKEDRS